MISSRDELIRNVNSLRRREGKNPLTKKQIRMIEEQVSMRADLGRFTLFPDDLRAELEKAKEVRA